MRSIPTTSSYQANQLLRAWLHSDAAGIAQQLDTAARFCRSAAPDAAELERRELLEGIVEEIARLSPAEPAEAATYLHLLEHLSRQ